jgi:hypothetical protein
VYVGKHLKMEVEVSYDTFPAVEAVRLGMNMCGTVRVSNGKSVRSPDLAAISRTYLSVLIRWGTKRPKREPKGLSYTRLPLIGRQMLHDACVATRGVTIHSDHETRRDTILGSLERDEICFIVTLHMHEI